MNSTARSGTRWRHATASSRKARSWPCATTLRSRLLPPAATDDAASLAALAELVPDAGMIVLLQTGQAPVPRGCEAALVDRGVQMLLHQLQPRALEHAAVDLGEADADDMVELATLTKPGPFLPGTRRLGRFVGIRIEGRLAAMAGERLRLNNHTEVSAVCTHPDFRGRGMAAQLSSLVAERILARGERPFIHAFADNQQAIRLYQSLGFAKRSDMAVLALKRDAMPEGQGFR